MLLIIFINIIIYKLNNYFIKNALISFSFSLVFPFIFNLIPGMIRIYSLKKSKRECIYKLNNIIQFI